MKNVKVHSKMTFEQYVEKAIKGLNICIPDAAFQSNSLQLNLNQIDRVFIFYSLRLLIAPIVELFILLDYGQYLREQAQIKKIHLIPLFEPSISPRNFILLAHK